EIAREGSIPTSLGCPLAPAQDSPTRAAPHIGRHPSTILNLPVAQSPRSGEIRVLPVAQPHVGVAASSTAACGEKSSSRLLIAWTEDQCHRARKCPPFRVLVSELLPAQFCQPIIFRPLAFLRKLPRSFDPPFRFQAMQGGIKRTSLDLKQFF